MYQMLYFGILDETEKPLQW